MTEDKGLCRLVTIQAANVVGHSRPMAANEVGTLAQFKTHGKRPRTRYERHGCN